MVKLRRYRGLTLKWYFAVIVFGVGSTYYIFRPVIDELEKRNINLEQKTALESIAAARKIK